MTVTVLIENTLPADENGQGLSRDGFTDGKLCDLQCEHGLSLLIEKDGKRILLDAGSTEQFSDNAKVMGISLQDVDMAVLSHGHYDHSGGLTALFRENDKVKVYAQKNVVAHYYSGGGGMHEIGVPECVLAQDERFSFVQGVLEPEKGMYLIPHSTKGLERIGEKARLYRKTDDEEFVPDDFCHEQSLVFDTKEGLVVFNSCSHGGVVNILREVKAVCGNKPIYAYIGGLHMKGKDQGEEICTFSKEELDTLCDEIRKEQIRYVYTGHCTGQPGLLEMKKRLGDVLKPLVTGLQFTL